MIDPNFSIYYNMDLIIAGSRTINLRPSIIHKILIKHGWNPKTIISGKARGADHSGELYAKAYGLNLKEFPAEWDLYGKKAGYLRNGKMAKEGTALLLLWDGESRGSLNMLTQMKKLNKPVLVVKSKVKVRLSDSKVLVVDRFSGIILESDEKSWKSNLWKDVKKVLKEKKISFKLETS